MADISEVVVRGSVAGFAQEILAGRHRLAASNLHTHKECANTEADARAKMLIYLLENNLIPSSGAPSPAQADLKTNER